jgi:malonyl-CoA O-methyltransferase
MIIKNQVIAGFNRGAKTYTKAAELQSEVALNLSRYFNNKPAKTILEIGCGTGLLTQHLIKAFPEADLLLTDISPEMIEHCNYHIQKTSGLSYQCMDAENPNKLLTYDLIVSSMTMHWFTEFESGLHTIKKHLKKGGRILFAMLTKNSFQEWRHLCDQHHYPIATPHFPDSQTIQKQFPEFNWHVQKIKKTYPNAHAFLKTLKSLGATAARQDYVRLTTEKMRKLLRLAHHEIEMTYEVVYGEYQSI